MAQQRPPHPDREKTVVIETAMGALTIELYWDHTPKTCKVSLNPE